MTVARLPRGVLPVLYLAGLLLLADQFAELVISAYPFRPDEVPWRVGLYGLLLGRTSMIVLADLLIVIPAVLLNHRGVLAFWGAIHLLAGVALGIVAGMFVLDAIVLRNLLPPGSRRPTELTSLRALLLGVLVATASLWAGWLAVREVVPRRRSRRGAPAPVVGLSDRASSPATSPDPDV